MRRVLTEILIFVTASTIIALCTAVVGAKLTAPPTSAPVPVDLLSGTCLDEPFLQTQSAIVGALARLCFDVDAVRPRIELTGLPSGYLFTAWLSQTARPAAASSSREACDVTDSGSNNTSSAPVWFDTAIADQTGRVQLTATMRGLRMPGGSQTRLFVVDHGWIGPDRAAVRVDDVRSWQSAWVTGITTTTRDSHSRGRLIGCASFWLRGGVETQEQ